MYNHSTIYLVQQTIGEPLVFFGLAYARTAKTYPMMSVLTQFEEEYGMAPQQVP
jgi:hypothetical protein